jgi:acyl carrier protein
MSTSVEHIRPYVDELRARVCPAVLGTRAIGADDDFFEAGGDSIELMRLVAMAQEHFDVDLEVREFFAHPTIAELARLICAELGEYRQDGS